MALNAARLPSRINSLGNLSSLFDQDRSQWDAKLIDEGLALLELSAAGPELTEYHLEAAIAAAHARAPRVEDTDWAAIAGLYDGLLRLHPSPVVALNRAIALAQSEGPDRGIEAIRAIADGERLAKYPFYPATLGELELRRGQFAVARGYFRAAIKLARNPMECRFLEQRVQACDRQYRAPSS
jgi:predicted RNA polymerase sigma factor